ncbi:MAG: Gfo/Idh/MocA family oxidoreductase [Planctomycetes bacterium]|nr:Gfo/Idh/MocA family oxidoreductase [Planctomycetota bacterium]
MSEMKRIIQVGIGGYGGYYLRYFLDVEELGIESQCTLVAGVDPRAEHSSRYQDLQEKNIPIYADLQETLDNHQVDLVIIATPIHTHLPLTQIALAHGASVLLEKPLCGSLAEADAMQVAEDAAEGFVAIGFQWHYVDPTRALLADMQSGDLGKLQSLKSIALWPRNHDYFNRSTWAGARLAANGAAVYDSPVMNACAHYLYHQLLIIGGGEAASAKLEDQRLMRANDIENFDTAALRYTVGDVEGLFIVSHSIDQQFGPHAVYQFEHAAVHYEIESGWTAHFTNGEKRVYGLPDAHDGYEKIEACLRRLNGEPTATCRIADARQHVALVEQLKDVQIIAAPANSLRKGDDATWVDGLYDQLMDAYTEYRLPNL